MTAIPRIISVVMVTYHTGPALWLAIDSVLAQEGLKELILVNNGNPPDIEKKLEHRALAHSRMKILSGHGNVGFARGCNLGVAQAEGEVIAFLNPDCILPQNALIHLQDVLQHSSKAMMVGGRLIHPDGSEQAGGRRRIITPSTAWSEMLRLDKLFPASPVFMRINMHQDPLPSKPVEVPAISGACMMIRKEDYLAIGQMDEAYFLHVEDMDLCLRIRKQGKKILFVPDVEILHFLSTSNVPSRRVEWWKTQSFNRYFKQHFSQEYAFWRLWLTYASVYGRFAVQMVLGVWRRYFPGAKHVANIGAMRRLLLLYRHKELAGETYFAADVPEPDVVYTDPILITGATSQVGVAILSRLLKEDAHVIAMQHRRKIPYTHKKLHWVEGDIGKVGAYEQCAAMSGKPVEVLIHCGPITIIREIHFQLFRDQGIKRLVAFSPAGVEPDASQGGQGDAKQYEVKLLTWAKKYGIHCTVLRPSLMYGVGLDRHIAVVGRFIRYLGFFPIQPPAIGKRQPVHVDDLACSAISVVNNSRSFGNVYPLAGGETLTYREMITRLFASMDLPVRVVKIRMLASLVGLARRVGFSGSLSPEMVRLMNIDMLMDSSRAREDFGYVPRVFDPPSGDMPWPRIPKEAEPRVAAQNGKAAA